MTRRSMPEQPPLADNVARLIDAVLKRRARAERRIQAGLKRIDALVDSAKNRSTEE